MGRRGPAPKPQHLRMLHGSELPVLNLPEPAAGVPTCPDYLSDRARAIWYEKAELLAGMKVLSVADGDALTVYANALAALEEITIYFKTHSRIVEIRGPERRDRESGVIILGPIKQSYADPRVKMETTLLKTVKDFGDRFGLSPAARTRITVGGDKPVSDDKKKKQRFF